MRYIRIFLLHIEHVFEGRSRAFVWFLTSIIYPLLMTLFWKSATNGGKSIAPGWNYSSLVSYYLFTTIAFAFLISHIEEDVSRLDIKEGKLVSYLLRPFS